MITTRSRSPLYVPLLLAVCGILFSVWNAQDAASVPCISAGCTLYQSFTVNGYSLWWGGVGIFTALAPPRRGAGSRGWPCLPTAFCSGSWR